MMVACDNSNDNDYDDGSIEKTRACVCVCIASPFIVFIFTLSLIEHRYYVLYIDNYIHSILTFSISIYKNKQKKLLSNSELIIILHFIIQMLNIHCSGNKYNGHNDSNQDKSEMLLFNASIYRRQLTCVLYIHIYWCKTYTCSWKSVTEKQFEYMTHFRVWFRPENTILSFMGQKHLCVTIVCLGFFISYIVIYNTSRHNIYNITI